MWRDEILVLLMNISYFRDSAINSPAQLWTNAGFVFIGYMKDIIQIDML